MCNAFDEALKESEYEDYVSPHVVEAAISTIDDLMGSIDDDDLKKELEEIQAINEETLSSYQQEDTAFQDDINDDNQNDPDDRRYPSDVAPHPYSREEVREANERLLEICEEKSE